MWWLLINFMFFGAIVILSKEIIQNESIITSHGINKTIYRLCLVALWIYYIPIYVIKLASVTNILIAPYPVGLILFIPGIYLYKSYAHILNTSGKDYVAKLGRTFENSVWLGYAGFIYFSITWAWNTYLETYEF